MGSLAILVMWSRDLSSDLELAGMLLKQDLLHLPLLHYKIRSTSHALWTGTTFAGTNCIVREYEQHHPHISVQTVYSYLRLRND